MRCALLALLALGTACGAADPVTPPLPVHVGGRVIQTPGGAVFGWPGVYFESGFRGTAVRVRFDAPTEHMRLLIDGRPVATFERAANFDRTFADLPKGDHVVRLEKQTESQQGGGRFFGFHADAGAPLPVRRRRIEFIGDSYTVGYGNTSPTQRCTQAEVHDRTDTQQAFGPRVARHYDADYRINAYSGFGMVRNYDGGSRGLSLPAIYPRLKPDDATAIETPSADWHPQVIVVNLGTNDFSTPLQADEAWRDQPALRDAYRRRYVAFVTDLARRHPGARFVLMGSELFFPEVARVGATLGTALPGRVTTLQFTGLDHKGCDAHPSLADHALMETMVERTIDGLKVWRS